MKPHVVLILGGLIALVAAAFRFDLTVGLAGLGMALLFVGWASIPARPKE